MIVISSLSSKKDPANITSSAFEASIIETYIVESVDKLSTKAVDNSTPLKYILKYWFYFFYIVESVDKLSTKAVDNFE